MNLGNGAFDITITGSLRQWKKLDWVISFFSMLEGPLYSGDYLGGPRAHNVFHDRVLFSI